MFLPYRWECKLVQPLWKTVWRFLEENKNSILYDPIVQLLDINMKKMRILAQKDTYSHIYCTNITHNSKI